MKDFLRTDSVSNLAVASRQSHVAPGGVFAKLLLVFALLAGVGATHAFAGNWTTAPTSVVAGTSTSYSYFSGQSSTVYYLRASSDGGNTWVPCGAGTMTVSGSFGFPTAGYWKMDVSTTSGSSSSTEVFGSLLNVTATSPLNSVSFNTTTYNGSAQTASVASVSPAGASYSAPTPTQTNAGTYTTSITGTALYTGTISADWTINPANQGTVSISGATDVNTGGSITFSPAGGSTGNYVWGGSSGATGSTVSFPTAGTYTVTVYDAGNGNYYASNTASITVSVTTPNVAPTAAMSLTSSGGTASSGTLTGVIGETLSIAVSGNDANGNLRAVNLWVQTPATGWRNIRSDSTLNGGYVENNTTDNAINSGGADVASLGAVTRTFNVVLSEGFGTYRFVTRSIDSASWASGSSEVDVTVANRAPAISISATPRTIIFGQTTTVTATGTDPDGNLSYVDFMQYDGSTYYKPGNVDYTRIGWNGYPVGTGWSGQNFADDIASGAGPVNKQAVWQPQVLGTWDILAYAGDTLGNAGAWLSWNGGGVVVTKATPNVNNWATGYKYPQSGLNYTVQAADLTAAFVNPFSGGVAAPTGTVTYSIVSSTHYSTGAAGPGAGAAVTAGTVLAANYSYIVRASYPGDTNYNSKTLDATWTVVDTAPVNVSMTTNKGTYGYGETISGTARSTDANGDLVNHHIVAAWSGLWPSNNWEGTNVSGWRWRHFMTMGASGADYTSNFTLQDVNYGAGLYLLPGSYQLTLNSQDSLPNYTYNAGAALASFSIVPATPSKLFPTATKTPQSGTIFIVNTGDLNATFANPYAPGSTVAPTGTITYSIAPTSPNGSPGNTIVPGIYPLTAGLTYIIRASYPGDANYAATTIDSVWTIAKANQTISLSGPTVAQTGVSVTYTPSGGVSGNYTWGGSSGATGTGTSKTIVFPSVGTYTVTAQDQGNTNYNPSNVPSITVSVTASPTPLTSVSYNVATYNGTTQTAVANVVPAGATYSAPTPTQINAGTYNTSVTGNGSFTGTVSNNWTINPAGQGPIAVTGGNTVTAGGSITFNAVGGSTGNYVWGGSSGASGGTSSKTVTFPTVGSFSVTVYDAGNSNYNASSTTPVTVNVTPATTPLISVTYNAATYTGAALTAVANVVPAGATYSAPTPTRINVGTYSTSVTGTGSYTGTVSANWTINKANQGTVSIGGVTTITEGGSITFTPSGGSTGTYVWGGTSGASGNGTPRTFTFPNAGTYTVTAQDSGNANYNPSNTATVTITVSTAQDPVTITSASTLGSGSSYTATAKGGSGTGALVWALGAGSTAPGAVINSSTGAVTATGTGTVVFKVYRASDAIYAQSATTADFTLTIKAAQTITFPPMGINGHDGLSQWNTLANATSSSGLPITYTFSNPAVVSGITLNGSGQGVVAMIGAGMTTITATQPGDATYGPAVAVSQTLIVDGPGYATGNANGYVTLVTLASTGSAGNFNCTVQQGDGNTWASTTVHASTQSGGTRTDTVSTYTGDTSGTLVTQSTFQYINQVWGAAELTSATSLGLTTTYDYYTVPTAKGNYRRLKSVAQPNGNWVAYQYYDDWNRRGQTQYEFHPFLDAPASVSFVPTTGRVVTFDYQPSWTGVYTRPLTREEKVNNTRVAYSTYTAADTPSGNGYWATEAITVTAYRTNTLTQTSTNCNRRADAGLEDPGRPVYSIGADGSQTSFNDMYGSYTSNVFSNTGTGYFRTLAAHGSSSNVDGNATLITKYDDLVYLNAQQLANIWMTPYKSTVDVCIYDNAYNKIREETQIYTGESTPFALASYTDYTYDARGRMMTSSSSNNSVASYTYYNGLLKSSIDATGIELNYTYDLIGRPVMVIKKGVSGQTNDISTITTYDGANRTRKTVVGGTLTSSTDYDLAGRILSSTAPGGANGYTSNFSYALGGRQVTVSSPSGATMITETYPDGSPKTATGTGTIDQTHSYQVDTTAGYARMKHTAYSAGISASATITYADQLGNTVEQRSPAFGGGAVIVQTWVYNSNGLVAKNTETGVPDTYYFYDALGRLKMQGSDIAGGAGLTPDSNDRITAQDNYFSYNATYAAWFATSIQSIYGREGIDQAKVVSKSETQLSFTVSGSTMARSIVTDIYGNKAESVTTVNRNAKTVTNTTTAPNSTTPAVKVSVNGLLLSFMDTAGVTTTYGYDTIGRSNTVTDTQNRTITTTYKPYSPEVATVTDAAGIVQQAYTYDYAGRTVAVALPNPNKGIGSDIRDTLITRCDYDMLDRKIHEWGDNAIPVEYVYNAQGLKWKMYTFAKSGSSFPSTASWPASTPTATTTWNYDTNTSLPTSKVDDQGHTVSYVYTAENKLSKKTNARNQITEYTYSTTTGELTDEKYFSGTTPIATPIHYDYDRLGRIKSVQDDAGTRTISYNNADANGTFELKKQEFTAGDFLGQLITYGIETGSSAPKGRSTRLDFGTTNTADLNQTIIYGYQPDGRISTINSGTNTYTYTYRATSHLIDKGSIGLYTDMRGYEASHDWSKSRLITFGAPTAQTVVSSFRHTFDNVGRITATAKSGALFTPYDSGLGGLKTAYAYSDRGELAAEQTLAAGATLPGRDNGTASAPSYTYDKMGNRENTKRTVGPAGSATVYTTGYTTDSLNRYTNVAMPGIYDVAGYADASSTVSVNPTGSPVSTTQRANEYFFNGYGLNNNITATGPGVYAVLTINDGYTTPSPIVGAYLPPRGFTILYDDDGNMTDDGKWLYTYNLKNQLISIETSATAKNAGAPKIRRDFTYDYMGRRVKKTTYDWTAGAWAVNTALEERYLYDGWNLAVVLNSSLVKQRSYVWGLDLSGSTQGAGGVGGLLMVQEGTGVYLPAYDTNGNVHGLVTLNAATFNSTLFPAGSLVANYEYDAFGNTLREDGPYAARNPFRFSTKYTDIETDLIYYGLRYYNPFLGRFINTDPIEEEGGLNLYGFCGNDGVNSMDYLGLRVEMINGKFYDVIPLPSQFFNPVLVPKDGLWAWDFNAAKKFGISLNLYIGTGGFGVFATGAGSYVFIATPTKAPVKPNPTPTPNPNPTTPNPTPNPTTPNPTTPTTPTGNPTGPDVTVNPTPIPHAIDTLSSNLAGSSIGLDSEGIYSDALARRTLKAMDIIEENRGLLVGEMSIGTVQEAQDVLSLLGEDSGRSWPVQSATFAIRKLDAPDEVRRNSLIMRWGALNMELIQIASLPGFRANPAPFVASSMAAESVWVLRPFARGGVIERVLGANLPRWFPTFDKFKNGIATSIKSLNLGSKTYQNAAALEQRLNGYVNSVRRFTSARFITQSEEVYNLTAKQIISREVQIVIPRGINISPAQQAAMKAAQIRAQNLGVKLYFTPYP